MANKEYNKTDLYVFVQGIIDKASAVVFMPDAVDLSRFYNQYFRRKSMDDEVKKSAVFVVEHNIQSEHVRNVIADLTIRQYSTTAVKPGCPDAYVFGVHMPEIVDGNPEIYLKFQIDDSGVIIVTIHEADRPMTYPYKEG